MSDGATDRRSASPKTPITFETAVAIGVCVCGCVPSHFEAMYCVRIAQFAHHYLHADARSHDNIQLHSCKRMRLRTSSMRPK